MQTPRLFGLCVLLPLVVLVHPVLAQQKAIDPKAVELLQQMSSTLASAKALTFHSESLVEVPAVSGQTIALASSAEVALKRPNHLRVLLRGEAPNFDFYFDGLTAVAYAPGTQAYSAEAAPETVDELLNGLEDKTGIRFVSAPLLFSDPYAVLTQGLKSAIVVGPAKIQGTACVHLAFRSPGVDWEIWISMGSRPLPLRLLTTFIDQPNRPRTLIDFSRWNLAPWLGQRDFVFEPPKGAEEIPFVMNTNSSSR